MNELQEYTPAELKREEWAQAKCDKYDFMIAAFCGAAAGLVDIFFVGAPGMSPLGTLTDQAADQLVKKAAKMAGWNPRAGNENNVASAIGFFESHFGVNYDQKNTTEVGGLFKMTPKNHHFKSLGHSPDPIGLFFSILDQFMGTSSFLSDGRLIRIDTTGSNFELRGSNFLSKLFCGFCNWIGHLMSDVAGSSGSRGRGSTGRGMGIPIPFMELFQLCDFGKFQVGDDRQTLAVVMTRAFQEGYDARFGTAMAIPVLMEELMIRVLWVIRQRFFEKKPWSDCVPSKKHADLRLMLIIGNGTLCLMDGADAAIRGLAAGGNALVFVLHLNLIAWARFVMLVFRELRIRYGPVVLDALKRVAGEILYTATPQEQAVIRAFQQRMEQLDTQLDVLLSEFTAAVEAEYRMIHQELAEAFSSENTAGEQAEHSVKLAEACGVDQNKIMRSRADMDRFFNGE